MRLLYCLGGYYEPPSVFHAAVIRVVFTGGTNFACRILRMFVYVTPFRTRPFFSLSYHF